MDQGTSRPSLVKALSSYEQRGSISFAIRQRGVFKGLAAFLSNPDHRPVREVPRNNFGQIPGVVVCSWVCKVIMMMVGFALFGISVAKTATHTKIEHEIKTNFAQALKLPELAIDVNDYEGKWAIDVQSCTISNGNYSTLRCVVETGRLKPCTVEYFREINGNSVTEQCLCFNGPSANEALLADAPSKVYWTAEGTFGSERYKFHQISFVYTGPGDGTHSNGTAGIGGQVSLFVKDMTASDKEPIWTSTLYKWATGSIELNYELYFRPVQIKETSWHGLWDLANDLREGFLDGEVSARRTALSYTRLDTWNPEPFDFLPNGSVRDSLARTGRVGFKIIFRSGMSTEELKIDHFSLLDVLSETGGFLQIVSVLTVTLLLVFVAVASYLQSLGMMPHYAQTGEHKLRVEDVDLFAHLVDALLATNALNPEQTDEQLQTLLNHLELQKTQRIKSIEAV